MSREKLIEVFKNTQKLCTNAKEHFIYGATQNCVEYNTFLLDFILDDESNEDLEGYHNEPAVVKVTKRDTLTAAKEYADMINREDDDGFVAILNFASATTPGGGVTKGSTAQEECLCRCTTLYPALNQPMCWEKYYSVNREANTNLGSDTIIYTQDVLVLKDKDYNLYDESDMFYTDVITCAAPNLREKPNNTYNENASKEQLHLTDQELYNIHVKRARHIFEVANAYGIDYLVLGAFGCGAFKNNPEIVAKAYKDVLPKYIHNFKVIDFAIIDGKYTNNYEVFKNILL